MVEPPTWRPTYCSPVSRCRCGSRQSVSAAKVLIDSGYITDARPQGGDPPRGGRATGSSVRRCRGGPVADGLRSTSTSRPPPSPPGIWPASSGPSRIEASSCALARVATAESRPPPSDRPPSLRRDPAALHPQHLHVATFQRAVELGVKSRAPTGPTRLRPAPRRRRRTVAETSSVAFTEEMADCSGAGRRTRPRLPPRARDGSRFKLRLAIDIEDARPYAQRPSHGLRPWGRVDGSTAGGPAPSRAGQAFNLFVNVGGPHRGEMRYRLVLPRTLSDAGFTLRRHQAHPRTNPGPTSGPTRRRSTFACSGVTPTRATAPASSGAGISAGFAARVRAPASRRSRVVGPAR